MKKLIFLLSIFVLSAAAAFDAAARYRGDLNGDDRVDLADMAYLAKAINAGSTDKALDVNGSGTLDDYDLHRLADIIISGKLTEDSGLNVGIGGWEDSGEDFGGTVKAPAFITRSADETRFYMRNPRSEGNESYSMEFGISECNEASSGVLFNVRLPREMQFDALKIVEPDPVLSSTHKIYGTPKFVREDENYEWSDYVLRFIVFSPDMVALPGSGSYGRIYYSVEDCWSNPVYRNCQVLTTNEECIDLPEHGGGYWGNFKPVEVDYIWIDRGHVNLWPGDEEWLYADVEPWDASDRTIEWTSTDENIVAVYPEDNNHARIKAISPGVATIMVSASNGMTSFCSVNVNEREMEYIELDAEMLELEIGDTHQFVATIIPADTTDPELEWWVDDETVATIDQNGFVTMVGEGSTTVHVRSVRWNHVEATCRLDVSTAVEGIIAHDAPCDIYTTDGQLLRKAVPPSEIEHLERGVYIIRQRGKTTKLLK